MNNTLITVLIASYNRLRLLERCINSVLEQTCDEVDILIVDDGSDIDTLNFVEIN